MTQTQYQLRTTICTPSAHMPDANQLALVLGESAHDDKTFAGLNYEDADGNLYAVCSTVAKPLFAEMAGQPLVAPAHAPDVDLESATRAQALLVIEDRTSGDPVPVQASPDHIAVILDTRFGEAQEHIASMGLTLVPSEEEL